MHRPQLVWSRVRVVGEPVARREIAHDGRDRMEHVARDVREKVVLDVVVDATAQGGEKRAGRRDVVGRAELVGHPTAA